MATCSSCDSPSADERRGERLSLRRLCGSPPTCRRGHLRNALGRAPADLHDVHDRAFLARRARDAHRIALDVLAVGDEQDDAAVIVRLRIARQKLARARQGARDGRAADGHVVRLELAEELRDGARRRT